MQKRILLLMLLLATVIAMTAAGTQPIIVHTIGDSTMSHYDQDEDDQKGMEGWGDYLQDCMKSGMVTVYNWADRGESSRSFYKGFWLPTVKAQVKSGDYVLMQFGHNDSKSITTAEYEEWMGTLVDEIRALGATPIIATSICRSLFANGKITRLGRIDNGDSEGVSEDDHTYDYPYHAIALAQSKGVEYIDVTTAVKTLFETFGPGKTKAFFPSGQSTHTNKLGAQVVAKLAADLLLKNNTALADYVDADKLTLPTPDEVDEVIDNFKGETEVSQRTIWNFNSYEAGNVIADSETPLTDLNGLFVRGYQDRAVSAVSTTVGKVVFSDDDHTEQTVTTAAQMGANTVGASIIGSNTAGRSASKNLAPVMALNVATPGTFYAIVAPTKSANDRYLRLLFSGKEVVMMPVAEAYAAANHLCELKYEAQTTGVIYLTAGVTTNVLAAMFVPLKSGEDTTEEDWNHNMVKTGSDGWGTLANLAGENKSVPEGLTVYAATRLTADGKVVLKDMGRVIPDGAGVVVKGEPNTEYQLAGTTEACTYTGTNLLIGNTTEQVIAATDGQNTNYFFADGTTGFTKTDGKTALREKKAYLSIEATADVLPITLDETADTPATETGTSYYISTTGDDKNDGLTRQTALATLGKAQQLVQPGDNVYILPGTYTIDESQLSTSDSNYKVVFNMNQKGTEGMPISFIGLTENGQRPVFDFSQVNPSGFRVTAFLVSGQYLIFRNFETIGVMVNITDHTQSENFRVTNGSYCTFDNIATHDGMGIGFYLTRASHHNLFLNCDSYNNYDNVSENGAGGQNDGFGCHVTAGNPENIFLGCRAWNNADDGYDLINCYSPVTFCYSFAYKNGYDATNTARGDGNGFKAGGYGMKAEVSIGDVPRHNVHHCIATYNKTNGFYANHHLGGLDFSYNSAYKNRRYNYSMVNRKGASLDNAVDVDGYGHNLHHNLSVGDNHITAANAAACSVADNTFYWSEELGTWLNNDVATSNFASTNIDRIVRNRKADGMLSTSTTLTFMKQNTDLGLGCTFDGYEQAITDAKRMAGAEVVGQSATMVLTSKQNGTAATDNVVYDLQGRRVSKTARGLYIKNGRKIVIR